jgi:hypothetical protein
VQEQPALALGEASINSSVHTHNKGHNAAYWHREGHKKIKVLHSGARALTRTRVRKRMQAWTRNKQSFPTKEHGFCAEVRRSLLRQSA